MLEIKYIVKNRDEVIERLKKRGVDYTEKVDEVIDLYKKRNALQVKIDTLRHIRVHSLAR